MRSAGRSSPILARLPRIGITRLGPLPHAHPLPASPSLLLSILRIVAAQPRSRLSAECVLALYGPFASRASASSSSECQWSSATAVRHQAFSDLGPRRLKAQASAGMEPTQGSFNSPAVVASSSPSSSSSLHLAARRPFSHFRSLSHISRSSDSLVKLKTKSTSTSELPNMTAAEVPRSFTSQFSRPGQSPLADELGELSTLPDPRSRTLSPVNGVSHDGSGSPSLHPDLNSEVATLSTKLINAINHQTNLDDTLSATRMELEAARERIRQLEDQVSQQREMLAGDVWVRRKAVEAEKGKLLARVAEEKRLRVEEEEQKRKIEAELESLTAALFEEANKMVVTAKEQAKAEYDALQRRNDQLKAQLTDTEGLLNSQQDQLAELKQVMGQMNEERDELQPAPTAPSSPGFSKFDTTDDGATASDGMPVSAAAESFPPSYPTSFSHLVQPVLRTDLAAFDDFKTLIRTSKRVSSSHNRVSAGSHSGLGSLGLALGAASSSAPSNGSSTSLANGAAPGSWPSPQTPGTPGSFPANSSLPLPALKETKFYKRVLAEDIEPTLRLDTAPGLSWLARRTVLNAMTDGSLVVEPAPAAIGPGIAASKPHLQPCSLCGELRRDASHLRTHRFRTSENDNAQRYPLCHYCLGRVRSTCDFLGFLRVLRDGLWRGGRTEEDSDRAAWEEGVRLREQMFWSRIGGGVVPAGQVLHSAGVKSPRLSEGEEERSATEPAASTTAIDEETAAKGEEAPPVTPVAEAAPEAGDIKTLAPAEEVEPDAERKSGRQRESTQSLSASSAADGSEPKRLSLTIPSTIPSTKH
jgi:hypothetical protein